MQLYIKVNSEDEIISFIANELEGYIGPVSMDPTEEVLPSKVRKYIDGEVVIVDNQTYIDTKVQALSKKIKETSVAKITVTVSSGKVFDGDEKSQDRMLRAINISEISSVLTTDWKMHDNSIVSVTLDELKEALSLAGQAMSDIWLS